MISRRNFLKYAGLAAAAAGTGFTAGKITSGSAGEYFSMQGFLPADDKILTDLFAAVKKNIPAGSNLFVAASDTDKIKIKKLFNADNILPGKGRVTIKMNRINEKVSSDILISDSRKFIYDPQLDNSLMIHSLRENIKNKPAEIFLSMEYNESGFLSSFFQTAGTAVFMNEKGIAERIDLEKDYREIKISGQIGNTIAGIRNGRIRVIDSCCKNKICTHTGYINKPGEFIACAPNKVLIKIEHV
jgi:hypothetical protein